MTIHRRRANGRFGCLSWPALGYPFIGIILHSAIRTSLAAAHFLETAQLFSLKRGILSFAVNLPNGYEKLAKLLRYSFSQSVPRGRKT